MSKASRDKASTINPHVKRYPAYAQARYLASGRGEPRYLNPGASGIPTYAGQSRSFNHVQNQRQLAPQTHLANSVSSHSGVSHYLKEGSLNNAPNHLIEGPSGL